LGLAGRLAADSGSGGGIGGQIVLALGIDVGSTNTKAVLVRLAAGPGSPVGDPLPRPRAVRVAVAPTPRDAPGLIAAVLHLVREVTAGGEAAPAVVGIASMAESGVPLDARGEPLTEILRWDGARAAAQARGLASTLGAPEVFAATGVRLSGKTPLATWAWLAEEHPATAGRMARWAGAADLVALAMTGRLVTDHTLAGRTGAYRLDGDDGALPAGRDASLPAGFDAALLAAVGMTPGRLPEVVRPSEAGRAVVVSPAFADAGVPLGTPVVVAGHDHAVGSWAARARRPGDRADSLGTAEAVLTVLPAGSRPEPAAVSAAGMSLVRTAGGCFPALVAGNPRAGALVAWWLGALGEDLAARVSAQVGAAVADDPRPTGRLVLPYPQGRQCPAPDPGARLRLIDAVGRDVATAPPHEDAATWTRALLEGLAFHARWMLEDQARLSGLERGVTERGLVKESGPVTVPGPVLVPGPVTVLGGASGLGPAWVAVKAAVSPWPVRVSDAAEPVALGAALLAASRIGLVEEDLASIPLRDITGDSRRNRRGSDFEVIFAGFVAAASAPSSAGPGAG